MANYYRRFVKNYSEIAAPLTALTSRRSNYEWSDACQNAFEQLKKNLTSEPVLRIPDPEGEFTVTVDASHDAKAIGAVLSQDKQVVAYLSKKLNEHEFNYTIHDKEATAIKYACREWRKFLLGKWFPIFTDHRSLVYLKKQKDLNQRQIRLLEELAEYDYEILYKPGRENQVADALSRIVVQNLEMFEGRKWEFAHGYIDDESLQAIVNGGARAGRKFFKERGILYLQVDETQAPRIVVPEKLRWDIVSENHDGPVNGHPGMHKTYEKTARTYYWPGMGKDVQNYVRQCPLCQQTKESTQRPQGQLLPLPIPNRPWQSIGMDFLGPLPKSRKGNDTILVVVDRLTKMAHFLPTKQTITSVQTAQLFVKEIFHLHGLPDTLVSDQDPRFTAHFWDELIKKLGIKATMSIAEHPQTDGQSEATVKTIQKMIRPFVLENQDWEDILPILEFAYNDTQSATTKQTPFFTNKGFHPRKASAAPESRNPAAQEYVEHLHRLYQAAQDAITDAQKRQKQNADEHRREGEIYQPDDWVLLHRKPRHITKLSPRWDGPFKVINTGPNIVTLQFPRQSKAYNVVNISRVKKYYGQRPELPTAPTLDDEQYEVKTITAYRKYRGRDQYYVHWKNFPPEDDTWEPWGNLGSDI